MARVYYSSILNMPAEKVWAFVRDFNNYPPYIDGAAESHIEDGKSGDTVGAVRSFVYRGAQVRQRLLAHSDIDRSLTYGSCEARLFPNVHGQPSVGPTDYQGTIKVSSVVETNGSFIEWWLNFQAGGGDLTKMAEPLRSKSRRLDDVAQVSDHNVLQRPSRTKWPTLRIWLDY